MGISRVSGNWRVEECTRAIAIKTKASTNLFLRGRMHLRKKRDFVCEGISHSWIMAFTATKSDVTERCNWACETLPRLRAPTIFGTLYYHFT